MEETHALHHRSGRDSLSMEGAASRFSALSYVKFYCGCSFFHISRWWCSFVRKRAKRPVGPEVRELPTQSGRSSAAKYPETGDGCRWDLYEAAAAADACSYSQGGFYAGINVLFPRARPWMMTLGPC